MGDVFFCKLDSLFVYLLKSVGLRLLFELAVVCLVEEFGQEVVAELSVQQVLRLVDVRSLAAVQPHHLGMAFELLGKLL